MPQPRKKSKPRDKRAAILGAARRQFASIGFHGTAVPAIARAANVATGSIYRYFPSKVALVNAVFRDAKIDFLSALQSDFPVMASPREQFRHIFKGLLSFYEASPERFAFLELHHHGSYLDKASRAVEETLMDFCRRFIVEAQAKGALKQEAPDILIAVVFGGFAQMVKLRESNRLSKDPTLLGAAEWCLWDAIADNANSKGA